MYNTGMLKKEKPRTVSAVFSVTKQHLKFSRGQYTVAKYFLTATLSSRDKMYGRQDSGDAVVPL